LLREQHAKAAAFARRERTERQEQRADVVAAQGL